MDVVDRRCRVSQREVDELTQQVNGITKTVRQLEGEYIYTDILQDFVSLPTYYHDLQ